VTRAGDSRRVDGKPETDADRRLFGLRESGWTGGVDQDGRKVTEGLQADVLTELRERGA
jgi:hypothetical protein